MYSIPFLFLCAPCVLCGCSFIAFHEHPFHVAVDRAVMPVAGGIVNDRAFAAVEVGFVKVVKGQRTCNT